MPVKVFCCYAREDEALLKKLKTHLLPLERTGLIEMWHDGDIRAGSEWEKEIDKYLTKARIVFLLVSPDFLASDYCYSIEMKKAIERHERGEATVIPVILRSSGWKLTPLGKLQALPKDGKPVVSSEWHNQDDALNDVLVGLENVVKELKPEPADPLSIISQQSNKDTATLPRRYKKSPIPNTKISSQNRRNRKLYSSSSAHNHPSPIDEKKSSQRRPLDPISDDDISYLDDSKADPYADIDDGIDDYPRINTSAVRYTGPYSTRRQNEADPYADINDEIVDYPPSAVRYTGPYTSTTKRASSARQNEEPDYPRPNTSAVRYTRERVSWARQNKGNSPSSLIEFHWLFPGCFFGSFGASVGILTRVEIWGLMALIGIISFTFLFAYPKGLKYSLYQRAQTFSSVIAAIILGCVITAGAFWYILPVLNSPVQTSSFLLIGDRELWVWKQACFGIASSFVPFIALSIYQRVRSSYNSDPYNIGDFFSYRVVDFFIVETFLLGISLIIWLLFATLSLAFHWGFGFGYGWNYSLLGLLLGVIGERQLVDLFDILIWRKPTPFRSTELRPKR